MDGPYSLARFGLGCALVALLATSCSYLEQNPASDPIVGAPASTVSTIDVSGADDDDEEPVETIADLEIGWAARRASVVAKLSAAQYGVDEDDETLRGPGRFEVDLGDCPRAWEDDVGVDSRTIRIAMTSPQSGPFSDFNDIALGMQTYFNYVNETGGIDGRRIELIVRDDAYTAETAVEVVEGFLEEDEPFYITNIGSPGALAVYNTLNRACIPQPFVASAHPGLGDPVDHPFTTGLQLSFSTEAVMWGNWIKQNLPDQVPVTVGAIAIDNDFGENYANTFRTWAADNRDIVSEFVVVEHPPTETSVTEQMAELVQTNPQVFLSMTSGDACLSTVEEAAETGLVNRALASFTPSGCRNPAAYMAPVGEAGHGFWVVGTGVKSLNDPMFADETFIQFAKERLELEGLDPTRPLLGAGFAQYGWAHVEALRIAADLPGGLTRSNLVLALRGIDLDHPMLLDGVRFVSEGNRDAFFVEGAAFSRYDSESEAWFQQGLPLDLNGTSPNCELVRLICNR